MVGYSSGVFHVVMLTPHGRLLECRASSVVMPGHDGQMGILRNHAPILVKLGFGLLRVEGVVGRPGAYFIVNGGFARVSENNLTILAYDVTTFEGIENKDAQKMLAKAKSIVFGGRYISQMEDMEVKKAALVVRMGSLVGVLDE